MNRISSLNRLLKVNGAAFLCLVIASVAAAGGVITLQQDVVKQAAELNRLVQTIHVLRGDLYRQLKELFDYVFVGDPDALVEFEAFNQRIERNLRALEKLGQNPDFTQELAVLRASYESLRGRARAIMSQLDARYSAVELLEVFEGELEKGRMLAYEEAFEVTGTLVTTARLDLDARLARHQTLLLIVLLVPLIAGIGLLLATRHLIRKQVGAPVRALLEATEAYRKGNLDHPLTETGPSEFLDLQRSFNRMSGELLANQKALIERERQATMGALVPIIAHNIRNPLASIRATAQVMQIPGETTEQHQDRQGIIRTVDRLEDWLSLLISYLNPLKPRKTATSMRAVVDQALHMLDHTIRAKDLEVSCLGHDPGTGLRADPNLLEQAVSGLLSNAIEASPPGAALIFEIQDGPDRAVLSILDQGPGMPFADGPSGLVSGPTTKILGSGLGLPFARKVCEIHGGDVSFRARSGGGTETIVQLPKAPGRLPAAKPDRSIV